MKRQAAKVAAKGRYGDTMLVHMNPVEVAMMHEASPTGLTINPDTGQPEAFLPMLGALAGGYIGSTYGMFGIAAGLGAASLGAGLGSFTGHLLQGDDVGRAALGGLTTGAMSYGLGSLFDATAAAASESISPYSARAVANVGSGEIPTHMAGEFISPEQVLANTGSPDILSSMMSTGPAPFGSTVGDAAPASYAFGKNLSRGFSPAVPVAPVPSMVEGAPAIPSGTPTVLGKVDAIVDAANRPDSGYFDLIGQGWDKMTTPQQLALGAGGIGTLAGYSPLSATDPTNQAQIPAPEEAEWIDEQFPTTRTLEYPPSSYRPGIDSEWPYFTPINRPRNTAAQGGLVGRGFARGGTIGPAISVPGGGTGLGRLSDMMPPSRDDFNRAAALNQMRAAMQQAQQQQPFPGQTIGATVPGTAAGQLFPEINRPPQGDRIPQRGGFARRGGIVKGFRNGNIGETTMVPNPRDTVSPDMASPDMVSSDIVSPEQQFAVQAEAAQLQPQMRQAGPGQQDPVVSGAIAAIMGSHPAPQQAIQAFIQIYGQLAFTQLRQQVVAEASLKQRQGSGVGRLVKGPGDGLSDSVPANIEEQEEVALSDGEVIMPADVVSDLGNGSSDAGAEKLKKMGEAVRERRHGTKVQPRAVNAEAIMPTAGV